MSHTSLGTRRMGFVAAVLPILTVGTACTRQNDAVEERGPTMLVRGLRDTVTAPIQLVRPSGAAGTYAVSGLDPDVRYVPVVASPDGATVGRGTIRQRPW